MISVEKIRRPRSPYSDARRPAGCSSRILSRIAGQILSLPGLLCLLFIAGCATDTIKPTVRAAAGLPKPDRVLVYDFEVAPLDGVVKWEPMPPSKDAAARTEEEKQAGRAAARVLADSLIEALRSRGITAQRAIEAAPPEMNTLTIRGRFLWREKDDGTMRARIWFYQGTGVNLRLQAESDAVIRSDLKRGGVANEAYRAAQEADARRMAKELAERVAAYYREQGWIRS